MDKNKSFQDLLQDSLKELQESKELKGEQHEQSNTAAPLFTFTDTIRAGIEEYNRHNRSKREQSQSLSQDRGNDSPSYHGSTLAILNQRKGRGRAMGEGTRSINTRSVSLKESNQDIQEIYSTQNRLSQTERREFSEILRETEIFKQQALQTYTDIQDDIGKEIQENLTHTQDSKENQESHTNTNESYKEHNEYLHSQLKILKQHTDIFATTLSPTQKEQSYKKIIKALKILKQHTDIFATTLSPTQKEQSYKKIIKALENIENLIESSNIDSKVLQNKNTQAQSTNTVSQNDTENLLNQDSNIALDKKDSMLIQKATKLVDEYERNMPRDKSRDR